MTEPVSRAVVEAFYEAHSARDFDRLAGLLADDVTWTISGPVDVLRFCGTHHGRAAVLDMLQRLIPQVYDIVKFEHHALLVEGDRAATLNRLTARHINDGRVISYRLAHFMRFREGQVLENVGLLDSFDAVEQVLGHSLTEQEQGLTAGDLIAV